MVYENRWVRVREDRLERADGSPGVYSVVEKRPAAVILPVHDDGSITLVEQYRHPVGERFWELPQGALDSEDDAEPEHIARTELAEETGLRAGVAAAAGPALLRGRDLEPVLRRLAGHRPDRRASRRWRPRRRGCVCAGSHPGT